MANLPEYHPVHLHDPDPICSRGLSVEDRARINKDKITAFPGAAAQDEAGPRIRNFHPSVLQGTWCHPAGRECFRALLSLQPQAPSANVLLAKAQLPMPSAASHPQAGPDSRPVRQPPPPAPFNTNPAAIRSLSCHCTAADCVSGTWDEGTPPHPIPSFHTLLVQDRGERRDMPGRGRGCGRRGAILTRPIEKMAPSTAFPQGSGSHQEDGALGGGGGRGGGRERGGAAAAASTEGRAGGGGRSPVPFRAWCIPPMPL